MKAKILILLPTLNEVQYISKLYKRILSLKLNFNYLFIDDGSNDGTWEIIKKIKKNKKNKVFTIKRKNREGIGKAHKDGLNWAYKKKYKYLVTMDTDFAHDPKYIPQLIKKIRNADLIIGSRYLRKNSTPNWPLLRLFLTHGAHFTTFLFFGHKFDSTNSFRCYNLKKINKNFILYCKSNDYDFFFTSLAILNLKKHKIVEIPMILKSRIIGNSKNYIKYIFKSIFMMFYVFFKIKFNYRFKL